MQKLLPIPSYSQGGKQKPTTTTTTTTRAYLTKHNIPIFCLWVLHHPKFFFNLQKGGKRKEKCTTFNIYIYRFIYLSWFCLEEHQQHQQQQQQSKEICDYGHGNNKRIKAHSKVQNSSPHSPANFSTNLSL
jgi:hypothetical protein